jgi:penicillin-binding protein 1A
MKLAVLMVWGIIGLSGLTAFYAYDLPDVDKALAATRRPTITIRAGDDSHLMTLGDIHGLPVGLNELPPALSQAVLATEDRRFYSHFGLDFIGLMRAAYENIYAGRIVQGGSTLTQQVAKNLFLTPERTLKRKVQELLLALWLEKEFSKDQILTVYLNRVYLGAGTYGVEAAAKRYFRKSARYLSTYEAAMLAGLLKAPSRYNPAASPKKAHARTAQVLANMVVAGYLTEDDRASLKAGAGSVNPVKTSRKSRYFSDWVLSRVADYVSQADTDIIVRTTLDRVLQAEAEKAIAQGLKSGVSRNVTQAALIAMGTDGAVRAMVGGADYGLSQFNRATQAKRQPGSAFKPVVYLAGLEAGLAESSRMVDEPVTIDGWSPRNYSRKYLGPISMAEALAHSVNTVAVKISEKVGYKAVVNTARRLGITSDLLAVPSLALGASSVSLIEMTAIYGVFANGGFGLWPYGIEEIIDGEGRVLYRRQGSGPGRVIDMEYAGAMNAMLAGVLKSGTGKAANFNRPLGGKTGTSQNFRDAWFIGYSADLVAGVWIGNDNHEAMKNVSGSGIPARIWRQFMIDSHARTPIRSLLGVGKQLPKKESGQGPYVKDKESGFWDKLIGVIIGAKN